MCNKDEAPLHVYSMEDTEYMKCALCQFEILKRTLKCHLGLCKRRDTKCFCKLGPVGDINHHMKQCCVVNYENL